MTLLSALALLLTAALIAAAARNDIQVVQRLRPIPVRVERRR